jgi:NADH-quinone oxidoreductase subunit K
MKKLNSFTKIVLVVLTFVVFWIFTLLQPTPLSKLICLGSALFCVGLYGVLSSKSTIKTLISVEILFNAANINLVAFSRFTDVTFVRGQIFALFVMAVAAAEAALALAIIISIYRLKRTAAIADLNELKG